MAVPGFRGWPRCLPIFCPSPHTAQFGLTGNYQSSESKKTKHAQTARGLHASQLCGETPTVSQLIWLMIVRFRFRLAQSTPKCRAHPNEVRVGVIQQHAEVSGRCLFLHQ